MGISSFVNNNRTSLILEYDHMNRSVTKRHIVQRDQVPNVNFHSEPYAHSITRVLSVFEKIFVSTSSTDFPYVSA